MTSYENNLHLDVPLVPRPTEAAAQNGDAPHGEQGGSSDTPPRISPSSRRLPSWDVQTDHARPKNGHAGVNVPGPLSKEIFPGNSKALDSISLRAFLLGLSLGTNVVGSICALYLGSRLWRPPFFLASLSLFHFLEFYVTAAHNTRAADVDAFLLSTNGKAYNAAHTAALIECVVSAVYFPTWQSRFGSATLITLGMVGMIIGQSTRSTSMAQAGTNFNHTIQTRRTTGHELVTHGVYAHLRHPSYFGFFWWGIGTQVVLGNAVCFLAYTGEEELLVIFFGKEYQDYRSKTRVGIPFIP